MRDDDDDDDESSERQRSRVLEKKGLWRFNDFFRLGEVSSVVFVVVVVVGVVDAESFE